MVQGGPDMYRGASDGVDECRVGASGLQASDARKSASSEQIKLSGAFQQPGHAKQWQVAGGRTVFVKTHGPSSVGVSP